MLVIENKSKKTIKEKVEESINKSGYPLELYVSSLLSNNYDIWNNLYYFDYDAEKSRTIDISAYERLQNVQYGALVTHFAIECKKSINKSWVFFGSETKVNYSYLGQVLDHSQIAKNDFKQKSVMWDFNDKLSLHYGDRNTRAFVAHSYHTQQIKSKNGNDDKGDKTKDNLFEDLNQVTKYTVYQMNNAIDSTRKRWLTHVVDPFFALVYPIIVFEGNMFTGELINDKIKLNESDHVVLEYRYQPRYVDGPKSYYIDVVKKDYFSHFLNSLKIEISNIHRSLKNSEKEIKANARFHQKYFDATKDTL